MRFRLFEKTNGHRQWHYVSLGLDEGGPHHNGGTFAETYNTSFRGGGLVRPAVTQWMVDALNFAKDHPDGPAMPEDVFHWCEHNWDYTETCATCGLTPEQWQEIEMDREERLKPKPMGTGDTGGV